MATPKSLTTEKEYDAALERVTILMDDLSGPDGQIADLNHPSRVELDSLVALIEAYEAVNYPMETEKLDAVIERQVLGKRR